MYMCVCVICKYNCESVAILFTINTIHTCLCMYVYIYIVYIYTSIYSLVEQYIW